MADIGSGSDLTTPPADPMEQEVLGKVPEGASADEATLNAQIDEIAGGVLGGSINDPRYQGKKDDSTPTDTSPAGDDPNANAGGDTPVAGADGGKTPEVPATPETPAVPAGSGASSVEPQPATPPAPKEYALTVQAADTYERDADGNVTKTIPGLEYKVEKIEDLPEDFNPRNNRQILEIINNLQALQATKTADEAEAAKTAATVEEQQARTEMLSSWDKEIADLQAAGSLATPKLKPDDPNYLTDPAMKRVADTFNLMEKINKERAVAGNPNMIRSFTDAFDKLTLADSKVAADLAAKADTDTAKLKAGVQGGGKAGGESGKAPVYVAGAAAGEISNML